MNDRMYADAATQANLATLRERGVTRDRARRRARSPRAASTGPGRLPEPERLLAEVEAALAGAGRRPGTGCGCSSPPAAPASRSTRCASSATARAAAWASRSPSAPRARGAEVTLVAANVALPTPPGVAPDRRRDAPPSWRRRSRAEFAGCPRAADGRRGRRLPARRAPSEGKLVREGSGGLELRLEADRGRPRRRSPPSGAPDQTLVGFAAEHGGDSSRAPAAKLERKGLDAIVVNDVSRSRRSASTATENEVTIVERRRRAPRSRSRPRRTSPTRSSTGSRRCARRRRSAEPAYTRRSD